ncbi:MAG TPA: YceI family protein [Edaphocola sp.]|nr:YceI family protein [Edaphocola sp.]
MKKMIFVCLLWALGTQAAFAQKYMTRTGQVVFDASTVLENIHAVNNETAAIVDLKTGSVVVQTLIQGFKMEKALMQEHFNEDYMESSRIPRASFKGNILDVDNINVKSEATQTVYIKGDLTVHGLSRNITVPATVKVVDGELLIKANFKIKPADYNITIPALVRDKIANVVNVTVTVRLKKM